MDIDTLNIILWSALIIYATYKVYNFIHGLNPYDFSNKK